MNNIRIENWCGYDIRFVEINGEWWAILKDVCDALNLKTFHVAQRLHPDMVERVLVERDSRSFKGTLNASDIVSNDVRSDMVSNHNRSKDEVISNDVRSRGENKTRWMLAINELGIYEALFASRRLEARKFRLWAGTVMQKLRSHVGLKQYEVMRMTEPDIQDTIDHILDSLFWDEETGQLMQSVTVQGGDVEQVPFE